MDVNHVRRGNLTALRGKVMARTALIRRLAGTSWGASTPTLRTSTLALVYAPAEYCAPVWCRSSHTRLVDVGLNASLRTITGCLRPTPVDQLPVLAEIAPPLWLIIVDAHSKLLDIYPVSSTNPQTTYSPRMD